jgi:hypothetical protein
MNFLILVVIHGRLSFRTVINLLGIVLSAVFKIGELINNTFSFLHLNIQSIVSKIDMISAEYSCHDIHSFTEGWLNENASTDQ